MTKICTEGESHAIICPVSGSDKVVPLCMSSGFQIFRCPDSATDFVHPMPSKEELQNIYNDPAWFTEGLVGGYEDYDEQTAGSLKKIEEYFSRFPADGKGCSILDIGCGYGSHLKMAHDRGWSCFGVELSSHAREIAKERHGKNFLVVENLEDLLPRQYDMVLILDVIEHLSDPYSMFFTLFGRGAIGPDTLVVISTPNARSFDALADPGKWQYRHPPSHLVFYSAKSFEILSRRLLFSEVRIQGAVSTRVSAGNGFPDEDLNEASGHFASLGLLVELSGSNFKDFMHERYVPGGFWPLTEYEHIPRYKFASTFANKAHVLDLGCGTGYGSSILADRALSVLGVDISSDAISWARDWHKKPNLEFDLRTDLGAALPAQSFDLITNFEMIEHVDHATQIDTIKAISRLLKPTGKLIISTPDPRYTAPYGVNPFHLREMTLGEFSELLEPHFAHVKLLKQWVRPSILIGEQSHPTEQVTVNIDTLDDGGHDSMVGYVAICSHSPFKTPPYYCQFDTKKDHNLAMLHKEHRANDQRLQLMDLMAENELLKADLGRTTSALKETRAWLSKVENSQVDDDFTRVKPEIVAENEMLKADLQRTTLILEETRAWLLEVEDRLAGQMPR